MEFGSGKGKAKRATKSPRAKNTAAGKKVLGESKKKSSKKTPTRTQKADTYNPPDLVDYEWNPKTRKYRRRCKDYQQRAANGRCVGRKPVVPKSKKPNVILLPPPGKEINPNTRRLRKICEPNEKRNARGRCVPRGDLKPGYVIDPNTKRPRLAFKEGYYRDPFTSRWKKIPRLAGVYDPANTDKNISRIRDLCRIYSDDNFSKYSSSSSDSDSSDYSGLVVFGKKQSDCGFGGCSTCALKKTFGKKLKFGTCQACSKK